MKKLIPLLGLAAFTLMLANATPAHAFLDLLPGGDTGGAPEIDPSSIAGAIALVMGGAAMMRDRLAR
jgi:hypothetical protein